MSESIFCKILNDDLERWIKNVDILKDNSDGHIKGVYAEITLKDILRKFIPQNLSISNGWIIDEKGQRTDERDILIYDRNLAPSFLFDISTGIIPISSILYDIQVKCSITENKLKEAMAKFSNRIERNALLSVHGSHLLEKYLNIDEDGLIHPKIQILSSEDDAYYFWTVQYKKYSEVFTKDNILTELSKHIQVKKLEVESPYFTINNVNLKDLETKYIKIYEWHRIKNTPNIKGFIVGLLNTLYKNNVSDYIVEKNNALIGEVVTRVCCDDEGNILVSEQNFSTGIVNPNVSFTCSIYDGGINVRCNKK